MAAPDEEHAPAAGHHVAHLDERLMQKRHRLGQVDDVDVVAGAEDVGAHLRVPAMGLMAEMNPGLEQLTHRIIRHWHCRSPVGSSADV